MRFFRARTKEDFMTVAQTNPAINEAWGVIKVLSGDERARALAEAREKARMDLDSLIDDARYDGHQEGLQEGEQKGRQDIALNLLGMGLPIDKIMAATGLSPEEVKTLAAELKS
jgi:predicted transposase/invertase (TIGR01784 family)